MQLLRFTEEKDNMKVSLMALTAAFFLVVGLPLSAQAGPTPGGTDTDGDTVEDAFDNCSETSNSSQVDCDHDGCGHTCDPDFTQDGIVGNPDFGILRNNFGVNSTDPSFRCEIDINVDGVVGNPDFAVLRNRFGGAPGPSGISNAGRDLVACPLP